MSKKKINPKDLELNDEMVSSLNSTYVATTRNTCAPEVQFPDACDTTMTDQSFIDCTTADLDKCPPTGTCATSLCNTSQCPTKGIFCFNTISAGEVCCPISAAQNCETQECKTVETRDYCLESEVTCQATIEPCLITQDPCPETSICAQPMSLDFDCVVDPTNI